MRHVDSGNFYGTVYNKTVTNTEKSAALSYVTLLRSSAVTEDCATCNVSWNLVNCCTTL